MLWCLNTHLWSQGSTLECNQMVECSTLPETLAAEVDDAHGCYFVPAFSGLFCPYWQPDARGSVPTLPLSLLCPVFYMSSLLTASSVDWVSSLTSVMWHVHVWKLFASKPERWVVESCCMKDLAQEWSNYSSWRLFTRTVASLWLLSKWTEEWPLTLSSCSCMLTCVTSALVSPLEQSWWLYWVSGIHVFSFLAVRPSMPETTALGAAMAACCAEGVNLCTFEDLEASNSITTDTFNPSIKEHGWQTSFSEFFCPLCLLATNDSSLFSFQRQTKDLLVGRMLSKDQCIGRLPLKQMEVRTLTPELLVYSVVFCLPISWQKSSESNMYPTILSVSLILIENNALSLFLDQLNTVDEFY